jgi:L-ribulose-5-phosphate 3-epimerase UlaE
MKIACRITFELEELDESDDKIARFDWKYLYNKHLLGILNQSTTFPFSNVM